MLIGILVLGVYPDIIFSVTDPTGDPPHPAHRWLRRS